MARHRNFILIRWGIGICINMSSIVTELQSVQLLLTLNHQTFVLVILGFHFKFLLYEDTSFLCIQVHFQLPALVFLSIHLNRTSEVTWRNYMCTLVIFLTPITSMHISALFTISTIHSILIVVQLYFFFKKDTDIFLCESLSFQQRVMNSGINCDGLTVTESLFGIRYNSHIAPSRYTQYMI